jgi:hypothetical protein
LAVVTGGQGNLASGYTSSVTGGESNIASTRSSSILGGAGETVTRNCQAVPEAPHYCG